MPIAPRAIQGMFQDALRHHKDGRIDEAVSCFQRVLAFKPDFADAHSNLGVMLRLQGRIDEAVAHYEQALVFDPGHADAHSNLGDALLGQGRIDEAVVHFERALVFNPGHASAHNNLGLALVQQGRMDEALTHYERALRLKPDYSEAHYNRAEIRTFRSGDADLRTLEALTGRDDLSADQALPLHFALAKALEDSGDYARAFEHLRKGNDLKRRHIEYDEPGIVKFFERIRGAFDSGLFDRFQGEGNPSSAPIFVLGMPRSGSTLIEQILASHPQIHAAGERNDLERAISSVSGAGGQPVPYPECVRALDGLTLRRVAQAYLARMPSPANGKVRIADKALNNFLHVGLIRLILPNARIVHTVRNPIDTCVSCYSKLFASGWHFSYDLAELGRYYRRYRELMSHWRSVLPSDAILDVCYEDVIDDLEGQARRLIDYCGLPWDDRCLNFHKTSRPVTTASAVQVRKPLFRSSLQRWRKYESGLAPLLRELGEIAFGYGTAQASGSAG